MEFINDCKNCIYNDTCLIAKNYDIAKNKLLNLEIDLDDSNTYDIPDDGAWQYNIDGESIHLKCKLFASAKEKKTLNMDLVENYLGYYKIIDLLDLSIDEIKVDILESFKDLSEEENKEFSANIEEYVNKYKTKKIEKLKDIYIGIPLLKYYESLVANGYRLVSKISTRLLEYDTVSFYKNGILIVSKFNREDTGLISTKVFFRAKIPDLSIDFDSLKNSVKLAELFKLDDSDVVYTNIIIDNESYIFGLLYRLDYIFIKYNLEADNNPETFCIDEDYINEIIDFTGLSVPKFDRITYGFLKDISSDAFNYIEEKLNKK